MNYIKPDPSVKKIGYRKCQLCSAKTETTLLYKILGKWACLSCGNRELQKWNAFVSEVDPATINTVSPR